MGMISFPAFFDGGVNTSMINVLYDTWMASQGYSGIPQDTRLLLKTLASTFGVKVDALVHPTQFEAGRSPNAVTQREISYALFRDVTPKSVKPPKGFKRLRHNLKNIIGNTIKTGQTYGLGTIDKDLFFDAIWRLRLEKSLLPADRELMRKIVYKYSPISEHELQKPGNKTAYPRRRLDTSGYDFMIFQDTRLVTAHPDTIKIIRYHDPLPIISPDTFESDWFLHWHYNAVAQARHDSFYVCNSAVTQDQLIRLFPDLEERSFVIPYTLPDLRQTTIEDIPLSRIVAKRRSFVSTGDLEKKPDIPDSLRYIIMVSTLEPRKNFPGAIEAFERLIAKHRDDDLRFVIVGRPGWAFEKILAAMAPGVRNGKIVHLTDVTFPELANLYRNAKALVFPSYGEGFGFTPMEALQFGTPGVVSDIAVHRWVMSDAVLYADPYDPDALVSQLSRLLYGENAELLRNDLIAKGDAVLDRYSLKTTSTQWRQLFEFLLRKPQAASFGEHARSARVAFKEAKAKSDARSFTQPSPQD